VVLGQFHLYGNGVNQALGSQTGLLCVCQLMKVTLIGIKASMRHHSELEFARHLLGVLALFVGPFLAMMAFRGWVKPCSSLPRWRNLLGFASIVVVGFSWLLIISLTVAILIGWSGAADLLSYTFLDAVSISSAIAFLMSAALRGSPRLQAAGASLLVFMFIWGSIYF
jgi:hypothetical protein